MKLGIKNLLLENREITRTIFKNTFWLGIAEVFTKGIAFLITVWIARHFGPEIYGQWAFAISFMLIFSVLADFGFGTLIVREVARDKTKTSQYIDNIIAMKLILGLITLGLIALVIQFLGKELEVVKLVYFLGVYAVLNTFTVFFQSIFRAHEKMQYETLCRALQSLSLLGLVALFILNKGGSIVTISYAYIGSVLIGILLSLIFIWRYFSQFFFKIDFRICKEILKEAWPFFFSGIFFMIYFRVGSVMLGIFSSMDQVGYYDAAYNLYIAIFILPSLISISFFPRLSYLYKEDRLELKKTFNNFKLYLIAIGVPLAILLFLSSGFIIVKIYSSDYITSIAIFKILSIILLFRFFTFAYGWFLTSTNEQKKKMKIQGVCAFLNIILNYFLIVRYNAIGAAIATLVTELILLIFYYLYFRKKWISIYGKG